MATSPNRGFTHIVRRSLRVIIKVIVILLLLIIIVLFLLQTSFVQNFGRKKIQAYLQSKLHTKVEIGDFSVGFPKKIILKQVYVEDLKKDTLLYTGKLELNVNLWKLLDRTVFVSEINLDNFTAKVKRILPDSTFNYDFILQAFSSGDTTQKVPADSTKAWRFELGKIHLTNIRGYYKDDATGNEGSVAWADFETNITRFDLQHMSFAIPTIHLTGVTGNFRQYRPLLVLQQVADTVKARQETAHPVIVDLDKIDFSGWTVAYGNDADSMKADLQLGSLLLDVRKVDLSHMKFSASQFALSNTSITLQLDKKAPAKAKAAKADRETADSANWLFDVQALQLVNNRFLFDRPGKKPAPGAVDYNHLHVQSLNLAAPALIIASNGYQGTITSGSLLEAQSGFTLKSLSGQFAYNDQEARLQGLSLETNHSRINAAALLKYASIASISKKPENLYTDLHFDHTTIALRDLFYWAPDLRKNLRANENSSIRINGNVKGLLGNLTIGDLELAGLSNTAIHVSGTVKGLPSVKKTFYAIQLKKFETTLQDLQVIVPANSLPASLRLPNRISANGSFNGSPDDFRFRLIAKTSIGNAAAEGKMNLPGKKYDASATLDQFNLGSLLKQDTVLGRVSLKANAKGSGFDYKTMDAQIHLQVQKAEYNHYTYENLKADANMQHGQASLTSSMNSPDLTYSLEASGNVSEKYPSILLALKADTVNLHTLHFVKDTLGVSFELNADFASTNPDSLEGKMQFSGLSLNNGHQQLQTDSVILTATHTDSLQHILLRSELATVNWDGVYRITEVGTALRQHINHYYHLSDSSVRAITPQNWQLDARFTASPLLLAVAPALKGTDTIRLQVAFASAKNDLHAILLAPKIQYGDQSIGGLSLNINSTDSALIYNLSLANAGKPGFRLYRSTVRGSLAHDQLLTSVILNDEKNKRNYFVGARLKEDGKGWNLSLLSDSLILNYDKWAVTPDNYIHYDTSGLFVHNLVLNHQGEELSLNSQAMNTQSPLDIRFKDFRIKTITSFAMQDSVLVDGVMNGNAELKNYLHHPVFTSDLSIHDLAYKKDTLGDLVLKVNNQQTNQYSANARLTGHKNDVTIDGVYHPAESTIDLNLDFGQLSLSTVRTIAGAQIKDISGYMKGKLNAKGPLTAPQLKGSIHFDSAYVVPALTGERLRLAPDPINFDEDGFNFSEYGFVDSAGNKATLDGNVYTKDFKTYRFDLTFSADNFRLVNAPRSPNSLFYGRLNIDADVDVVGEATTPKINADLRVNKLTDLTIVLPSNDPEVVGRQGVVVFVDKGHPTDTARLRTLLDSLSRKADLTGIDVAATIETDSSAVFTMIIDERNGDALSIRGRSDLVAGIDRSGNITLTGNYELESGSYNLSLSVLKRNFLIQRGSTITWTGDPRTANIDITASYLVNAPSIDLVQQQLAGRSQTEINRFKQKLPFRVNLHMLGELLKPVITFDISLPEDQLTLWPEVDNKLNQMKTDVSETNKQVFALLLLNRFVSENPFVSAAGGTDAETLAKQSASKILTDQVNQLAASLIKGVDLSFDLNSDKDYSSGQAVSQTQLNVGVSKSLFSDRVRVSVGSNFQLEQTNPGQNPSNIVGDVNVDYKLSQDGRYMIRAYRKDQYTSVVEGQVVETGLSFILTFDYNEFFELFRSKKKDSKPHPKKHNTTPAPKTDAKP